MPPKLTTVLPVVQFEMGEQSVKRNRDLALLIAQIVAASAYLDAMLGRSLANLLGTDAELGIKIHQKLRSDGPREAILRVVAESKLDEDDRYLFLALVEMTRNTQGDRNKVVHGLWGFTSQRPDCLVWIPTGTYLEWYGKFAERESRGLTGSQLMHTDISNVELWDGAHFKRILHRLDRATQHWYRFWTPESEKNPTRAEARQKLCTEPEIQTELRPLLKKNPSAQARLLPASATPTP